MTHWSLEDLIEILISNFQADFIDLMAGGSCECEIALRSLSLVLADDKSTLIGSVNTLKLRQNGRHFPDDIFKCIFLNENVWTSFKISLMFVPLVWINNIPALVQIIIWTNDG